MVRSSSIKRMRYDCIGLGVNAIDYLGVLDPYPQLDEKVDVVKSSVQGGGPVPTAMVTLARLGSKVCYVGKVGADTEGDFVKAQFEKQGVDTRYMITDRKTKTSRAFIWVDKRTGKRTVALDRDKKDCLKESDLAFMDSASTRFLHLDAREPEINIEVARWARRLNAEVCLDVGSLRPDVERIFPYIDHLIVSKRFACSFMETADHMDACRKMMKYGCKTVVVTLGEEGCICGRGNRVFHSPGYKVRVTDTTGAGDVFHGAFIYGLLRRWTLKRIASFANACAALKCRKLGGRAGIPNLIEVTDLMESFR
jgi:sulfofructose kinase